MSDALRAEICRVGASLYVRGYVHASAGNISVRLPDAHGFLITPTDACLGFLEPAQLAHARRQVVHQRAHGGQPGRRDSRPADHQVKLPEGRPPPVGPARPWYPTRYGT